MKIRCKKCQHLIVVSGDKARAATNASAKAASSAHATSGGAVAASSATPDDEQTLLQDLPAAASSAAVPTSAAASSSGVAMAVAEGSASAGRALRASARVSVAPAQLDVQWFVSLDGQEVGPLTLTQAQDWVRARLGQGEMFCWSEGFDEWMAVEKVSHFRQVTASSSDAANPFASLPRRDIKASPPPPAEDSGDLDIGEVSRIVNIAELAKADAAKRAAAQGAAAAVSPATPAGGASPAAQLRRTVMIAAAALPAASPEQLERTQEAIAEAKQSHRRSSTAVLLVAVVVALGAAMLIVALATQNSGDAADTVGSFESGTDRLGQRVNVPGPMSSGGQGQAATTKRNATNIRTTAAGSQVSTAGTTSGGGKPEKVEIGPDGQKLLPLTGDDVIAVSAKMQSGTRRCYERAQKEDPFFKAPKIIVRVVVDKAGAVSSVKLDKAADTSFGKCLESAIRRWPFRASTEGITIDLPLVFGQG